MFLFVGIKAQPFSNGWINYSQNYYKIKVVQNGIYRIDSATLGVALAANGIQLSSINPQNIQIFNKGVQQYIYIQGESDGVFNGSDFIEFYAEKNNGALDSLLYVNTPFIPNPYYSLINDTAVYFLTWNNSNFNNRLLPETDVNFAGFPTQSPYFFKDEVQEFHSAYYDGETRASGGTDVRYTRAEGWFGVDGNGDPLYFGNNVIYPVNTKNVYTSGPNALLTTVIVGESREASVQPGSYDHNVLIEYQGNSNQFLSMSGSGISFLGYQPQRILNYNLNPGLLAHSGSNPITNFRYTSNSNNISANVTDNRTAISYIEVKYPHTSDLEGNSSFLMYVPNAPGGQLKSHYIFTNLVATGTTHIYDLSNAKRISVIQNGSNFAALVPNSPGGNQTKCFINSDGNIINITTLLPVTPTAQFTNYSTPIDSAYIIVTNKSLMASANAYKVYRSGITGGSQNAMVVDIDDLYDQFAYGIVKSPLAIRGFCDFMIHTNSAFPPHYLFLMGKSFHVSWTRQNGTYYANCLVPSFGNPSSDILLTAGLTPGTIAPAIPTGRLAATSITEVNDYLTKVQLFESPVNDTGDWKKQVLHFGGGSTSGEQNAFKYYLNGYRDTIQNIKYGGNVKSFFKSSSAPIQINTSDTLRDLINNGVSLMTFFGHASGSSFDQSLDNINSYNPIAGHYPFLLANSCYAGDIHADGSSSEIFVLTARKGMIGYLGSVSLGISSYLNNYSREFYSQLSKKNYGKGIGYIIQKTIGSSSQIQQDTNTCWEMTLHGDPAVKINPGLKPDYKITGNDVTFDVLSNPDHVIVKIVRTNVGKATNDSSITQLIRTFPDGTSITKSIVNREPHYKDTLKFTFKVDTGNTSGAGLNKFYVTLDRNNTVDEANENNNATGEVDLIITGGDILPVYPYEFAIVPTDTVTLKATTSNLLAPSRRYVFQIDTTDTFNSPFLHSTTINSVGGVVKWNPHLSPSNFPLYTDSTVYYWRVSPDSLSPTSGYKWRESSFQYINNKKGWEQAHFFQFKKDEFQYVHFNRPQRKFNFFNDIKVIGCTTGGSISDWYNAEYTINSAAVYHEPWMVPSLTFAFFDPISGNPIQSIDNGNGSSNWGNYALGNYTWGGNGVHEVGFDYWQIHDSAALITNLINNIIPNGDYVLAFSPSNLTPFSPTFSFDPLVRAAFNSLGASRIDTLRGNRPYIMFGRKGSAIGTASEIIGDSANAIIHSNNPIITNWNDGYIKSPIIGPAANSSSAWHSLHWRWKTLDGASTKDSIVVKVIGINTSGVETVLAHFPKDSLDVLDLSTYVNATQFPYIRLEADMKDDSMHSPPQLKRWHVVFDPVPECAINPAVGGVHFISKDTVQEGDNFVVQIPVQNIGSVPFTGVNPLDSLLITQWVVDANGVTHHFPDKLKKEPFVPNQVIIDTISIRTYDSVRFRGNNALWVEVNPLHKTHSQLEQYHFNNIIRIPFRVSGDRTNPLLDVTFDGVHILNADIVSAKPNILMKLKDENQFLALNDTNDFKVFLQSPASTTAKRIWFGSTMSFVPAVLPNNSCKINYTPVFPLDGTYQLIVQAKDISSNQSGAVDYKINFEVINKATITEVMNYPNPFSTATHFVFTLTGSQLPSNFKIQIMTITGKVVREIFEEELGFIHVGRNITDYAWDGRDEFGDRLANGVYLYRVITKLHGEDIERRETEADQYFKKGWGKMYLMR